MRAAFAKEITELTKRNEDLILLSGDIGNRMFDEFKNISPNRFYNCGIAEGSMMSVAAGLALSGLRPIVYTITPFTTLRCLEQIKIGAAYHDVPIIIVGTGSGLSYAELGATHHSLDDISIIRSIPNIKVLAPCDSNELVVFINEALNNNSPTYIRIGKKGEPIITKGIKTLGIGKANILLEGTKNLIIGIGPIISEALEACDYEKNKFNTCVASMGSIKPLDTKFLKKMSERNFEKWIILEEHSKIGGLSSAILEWKNDNQINTPKIIRLGVEDKFIHKLGKQNYIRKELGLDSSTIKKLLY